MDRVENYLSHYGVLGMKWGVRRRSGTPSSGTAKLHRRRKSEDFKLARELRKKGHKRLTNEELKRANERANLEKNFAKLNPGTVERGHERVKAALAITTTAAAVYALPKTPMGQAFVRRFLKKSGSMIVKEGASFV